MKKEYEGYKNQSGKEIEDLETILYKKDGFMDREDQKTAKINRFMVKMEHLEYELNQFKKKEDVFLRITKIHEEEMEEIAK